MILRRNSSNRIFLPSICTFWFQKSFSSDLFLHLTGNIIHPRKQKSHYLSHFLYSVFHNNRNNFDLLFSISFCLPIVTSLSHQNMIYFIDEKKRRRNRRRDFYGVLYFSFFYLVNRRC